MTILFKSRRFVPLTLVIILYYLICIECHLVHDHKNDHEHDHNHIDMSHDMADHSHDGDHEPLGPPQQTENTINDNDHCDETSSSSSSWTELFIPPSKRESFWNAILSTIFIGCAPILCIKFVSTKDYYLKMLLAFASGGLMGDVFLHLLPTALTIYESYDAHHQHYGDRSHSHSHNAGYSLLGIHILIGFGIFFILEKIFHETGSAHCEHEHGHDHEARKHAITVLSICADASHNFTDGLTIAASFLLSFKMGIIQTISILLHEIPHEIGDYAILIENGVSKQMAMSIQFLTAIGCLMGTICGFILENTEIGTKWIMPFTAGGFLYISCVQVLPTLVEKKYGILQSTLHILFFIIGIALMIFVGYVEENAERLFDF